MNPAPKKTTSNQPKSKKKTQFIEQTKQPHRVLILCDLGINRSVTLAGQLKFMGNEVLVAGINNSTDVTLHMLTQWAETIILTEQPQASAYLKKLGYPQEFQLWDMGPDVHPRPYNPTMLKIAKDLIKQHPEIDHRG